MEGPGLAGGDVRLHWKCHGFNAVFFVVSYGVGHAVHQAGGLVAIGVVGEFILPELAVHAGHGMRLAGIVVVVLGVSILNYFYLVKKSRNNKRT